MRTVLLSEGYETPGSVHEGEDHNIDTLYIHIELN